MRTVLIGAVESSATALSALQAAGHAPTLLITLDPELGRQRHSDYVDLAPLASSKTKVVHVRNANAPEVVSQVQEARPDFIMVIGWSQIVGADLQSAAKHFTIGFHPTALPLHRGRAPLAWTILLGLESTASSLFVIDEGVDSGPLLKQRHFDVGPREDVASLMSKHMESLRLMLADLVPELASGTWHAAVQDSTLASYCAGRRPEDGLIDWSLRAEEIDRLVRATTRPYPGAFSFGRAGRVTIWSARPLSLPHPYIGQIGQVLTHVDGKPVVQCGEGTYLHLLEYESEDGKPVRGQPRFVNAPNLWGSTQP